MSISQRFLSRSVQLALVTASLISFCNSSFAQLTDDPSGPGGGIGAPGSPTDPGSPGSGGPGGPNPPPAVGELIDVLISFQAPPTQAELNLVQQYGGNVKRVFKVVPALAASIPTSAIPDLLLEPSVALVEEDIKASVDSYAAVWGVTRVGARAVHEGTYMPSGRRFLGTDIKVAVFDTGVDYLHPDLLHAFQGGYDYINDDADPMDDQYHGTHVSGTVAAGLNGFGVVGVAPRCDLHGLKVLDDQGSGPFSAIIAALDYCVDNQIHVANLSLGSSLNPGSIVEDAFDATAAFGVVIVCSAGNSGTPDVTDNNVGYPARYDSVIAVANTTIANARSPSSSTGPAVDIAAPGTTILSTLPRELTDPPTLYGNLSGTSMSAPHVAGCVALLIQSGVKDRNRNGSRTDEIRQLIRQTAIDLGPPGRDNIFGDGLIQIDEAIKTNLGGGSTAPPGPIFKTPTNVRLSRRGRSVTVRWNDVSNVESAYQIRFGNKRGNTITWRGSWQVSANSTSARRTMPVGTWYFQVRAVQGPNTTAWSAAKSITVR